VVQSLHIGTPGNSRMTDTTETLSQPGSDDVVAAVTLARTLKSSAAASAAVSAEVEFVPARLTKSVFVKGPVPPQTPLSTAGDEDDGEASDQGDVKMGRKLVKTSQFRGVRFCKKSLKYVASISHKGKVRRLGVFPLELDAAKAYDEAAYKIIESQPDVPAHQPKPNFDQQGNRIPYCRRARRQNKVLVEDVSEVIRMKRARE
jgi:hypothetical protein